MVKKGIALIVIFLFVGMIISPTYGYLIKINKNPSYGVTIEFNPPEPDGDNGWYKTYVEVYFMGDNGTIIDHIEIRIDGGSWQTVSGSSVTLWLEGNCTYDFCAIDTDSKQWCFGPYEIKIDTTPPLADDIAWNPYKKCGWWYLNLMAHATDETSGMDRVEFYIENKHNKTSFSEGPDYVFTVKWTKKVFYKMLWFFHYDKAGNEVSVNFSFNVPGPPPTKDLIGIISNREIKEGNVSFFAIIVLEPFSFYPFILRNMTLPNDYSGYIGRFFVCARFYI